MLMSIDTVFKDHFSGHVAQFTFARHRYPRELVKSKQQEAWFRAIVIQGDRAETVQKMINWLLSLRVAVKPT
tara:strand:+ start:227 stop:442 length:216 start_codon:yes stop_codon:yes gene_type:complete